MAFTILGFTVSWPLVGTLVAIIVGYEIWHMTYFKRKGIKGPTPYPVVGNSLDMFQGIHWTTQDYVKKYGNVFGMFMFSSPVFFISDLEMVKDITVKSFSKFMNHKTFVLKSRPFDKALTGLKDQHWKDVRNVITPTFSAVKMKQLSVLLNESSDTLVKNFGAIQEKDGKVKVFGLFEAFTMDGIAKCAFGIQVDSQNDPSDPFVTNAKDLMKNRFSLSTMIAVTFPRIGKIMDYYGVSTMSPKISSFFISVVDQAIAARKESGGSKMKDFLQLMLNAAQENKSEKEMIEEKPQDEKVEGDLHALIEDQDNKSYFDLKKSKKTTLTKDEIYGQAIIFFLAGYETINTTLGFLTYSLATNPEVQDKLIEEIDNETPTREDVGYNSIAKMSYLDNVVCEILRLYPAGVIVERQCNETHVCNGLTIPKDSQVMFPVFAIHRDPAIWPDPEKFDPERFTKENREGRHPLAWMPFGAGPRNCIGMRFALMEIKMATVRLLQKYRFETCPETQIPPKFAKMSLKPDDDLYLRVVERS
ncbi:cytochrome P450 3A56 [Strongylocentrotus purpuratus]|uniref:Thromboxane-A synthase n=1 Tax=Strongylocentrotus purpuratus TaxID=7668 RepID=A0A7M7RF93_STRPU|nr:cytochrome P450 3A56 [Strongylocentrotus purpuratus]